MAKAKKVRPERVIRTWSAYDVNRVKIFPETEHIPTMLLRGYKVEVAEFSDGVTNLVIEGPHGCLATMEMYERDSHGRRCKRSR